MGSNIILNASGNYRLTLINASISTAPNHISLHQNCCRVRACGLEPYVGRFAYPFHVAAGVPEQGILPGGFS